MSALVTIAKTYLMPGTTWFLVIGVTLGLVLLYGSRSAAWGRRWLVALVLLYVTMSVPAVALWGQRQVARSVMRDAQSTAGIAAIVVLGNGVVSVGPVEATLHLPSLKTALNITEAVRQYQRLGRPRVIASGGIPRLGAGRRPEADVMRDHLIALGVKPDDIAVETTSTTTVEQAAHVSALLPKGAKVLLVTMPLHMPRAQALFRTRGLDVVADVSEATLEGPVVALRPYVPSPNALRASVDTVHELLGLLYYRLRGDISGS